MTLPVSDRWTGGYDDRGRRKRLPLPACGVVTCLLIMVPLLPVLIGGCAAETASRPPLSITPSPTATHPAPTPALIPVASPVPAVATTPVTAFVLACPLSKVLPEIALDVELFYAERWMRVRQTVVIENTTSDAWNEIVFSVPINYVPEAFYLDATTVATGNAVQEGTPPLPHGETILRVPLPHPVRPGETARLEMRYRVVIPPVAPTDWPPIGTTGWTFDLIQAGEWYPALVPYIEGRGWHTWRYHPVGDPTVYPLVNYDLSVRTGPGITIVSGGPVEQGDDGAWHFRIECARGIAFFASDRYEMLTASANGIPIYSYYLTGHAPAGQAALDIAAQSLMLFEELYGPYPGSSLTVVENGFFGGMEYTALISITDYAYYTYPGGPPSLLHALVSHESAHQWWYGAVGNDQVNEPWLDESLAFYSELLYFERYYPDQTGWWWQKRVFQYNPYGPVDATIYTYDTSRDFILSMYGQAAQFIHALRGLMGDDAFFAFLRDHYATYRWQLVTADDFFAMVRRHTDQDLGPLLEAYFANPGH